MDIDQLKSVSTQNQEGEWVDDLPTLPGVRLLMAASVSQSGMSHLGRQLRKSEYQTIDEAPAEWLDRMNAEALIMHALRDWEGFTQGDQPVQFSVETALQMLDVQPFVLAVMHASYQVDAKARERLEALAKN